MRDVLKIIRYAIAVPAVLALIPWWALTYRGDKELPRDGEAQ